MIICGNFDLHVKFESPGEESQNFFTWWIGFIFTESSWVYSLSFDFLRMVWVPDNNKIQFIELVWLAQGGSVPRQVTWPPIQVGRLQGQGCLGLLVEGGENMGPGAQRPTFITFLNPGFSFLLHNFIYLLFLAALGLCCHTGPSPAVASGGYLPAAVCGLLIAVEPWL